MKRRDVLETIEWAEDEFGSLITNAQCPRRDVLRCVAAGLVQSAGFVVVLDEHGYARDPERTREGFKLTDAGRAMLRTSRP